MKTTRQFTLTKIEVTLVILTALYICINLASNILAHKQINIFGFVAIGSSIIYPLTYGINDVVTEVFGFSSGRMVIWVGILCDIVFIGATTLIVTLPSPAHWNLGIDSKVVIYPIIRTCLSGFAGILIGRFLNIYVLAKLKIFFEGKYFWFRSLVSSISGIAFHSIVTDILIFVGVVSSKKIASIIIFNILSNALFTLIFLYLTVRIAAFLKRRLAVDVYDYSTNFNPFLIFRKAKQDSAKSHL